MVTSDADRQSDIPGLWSWPGLGRGTETTETLSPGLGEEIVESGSSGQRGKRSTAAEGVGCSSPVCLAVRRQNAVSDLRALELAHYHAHLFSFGRADARLRGRLRPQVPLSTLLLGSGPQVGSRAGGRERRGALLLLHRQVREQPFSQPRRCYLWWLPLGPRLPAVQLG